MRRLWNIFKKKRADLEESHRLEVENLRLNFKARYHSFKLLISANNKSLENTADIEKALQGDEVYGMRFIRSRVTAISVSVFSMIKHLRTIAGEKYQGLEDSFFKIEQEIIQILSPKKDREDPRLVIRFRDITPGMASLVGDKMAKAAEIKNMMGLIVPEGFVITAAAYDLFMNENKLQAEIDRLIQSIGPDDTGSFDILSSRIRALIMEAPIPEELEKAVRERWDTLVGRRGRDVRFAVRSSAMGEDSEENSFAGQYRSDLNVSWEGLFDAYREVVASKYSAKAILYKLYRGVRDEDISMSVGCMEMVDAVAGGVAYSRNPLDSEDMSLYINAAPGLPKAVVDGQETCDLFVVSRGIEKASDADFKNFIEADIREKKYRIVSSEKSGVVKEEIAEEFRYQPAIPDDKIKELFHLAIKIEDYYKCPQDIEWAIDKEDRLYILQSRPLRQLIKKEMDFNNILPADLKPVLEGGTTASPGAGAGEVFKVLKEADILKFPQGAVLLVKQALPAWASMINRASAVVSEQGSFAGHLANVAREFNVPALFALEDAMSILKRGDKITVDADACRIYPGTVDVLLENRPVQTRLMEGSPIEEVLKKISEYIIPLNLLDPGSRDFSPENCRTFHDITRFIHEKSVHEMFQFGKRHNFRERSSKQLHYGVPMKWWILNLDDGFNQVVQGKYVKIDQIASIPMLAFWKGYVAKPWEGPPPLDGKGFASVMFQSTVQTNLVTGMPSKYANRNYFMLSRNYCSLNSRLGYHFSTLEALVSSRAGENYVSFQFKGGAADVERKVRRVHFIGELLEKYGFRVDIKQDNLRARLEGYNRHYMEKRLTALGYLTLHTRQLDMIMTNPARVTYYREKIIKDVDELIAD